MPTVRPGIEIGEQTRLFSRQCVTRAPLIAIWSETLTDKDLASLVWLLRTKTTSTTKAVIAQFPALPAGL
jgi:hypothetical protein